MPLRRDHHTATCHRLGEKPYRGWAARTVVKIYKEIATAQEYVRIQSLFWQHRPAGRHWAVTQHSPQLGLTAQKLCRRPTCRGVGSQQLLPVPREARRTVSRDTSDHRATASKVACGRAPGRHVHNDRIGRPDDCGPRKDLFQLAGKLRLDAPFRTTAERVPKVPVTGNRAIPDLASPIDQRLGGSHYDPLRTQTDVRRGQKQRDLRSTHNQQGWSERIGRKDLVHLSLLKQPGNGGPEGVDSLEAHIPQRAQVHYTHLEPGAQRDIYLVKKHAKMQRSSDPSHVICKDDIQLRIRLSSDPEPSGQREPVRTLFHVLQTKRVGLAVSVPELVASAVRGAAWMTPSGLELRGRERASALADHGQIVLKRTVTLFAKHPANSKHVLRIASFPGGVIEPHALKDLRAAEHQ